MDTAKAVDLCHHLICSGMHLTNGILGSDASEEVINEVSKKCLLSPAEVRMWFEYLTQMQ